MFGPSAGASGFEGSYDYPVIYIDVDINSGRYKTNLDIGVPSKLNFDNEVKKYCSMWREGGQFSTEKYNSDKIDIKIS